MLKVLRARLLELEHPLANLSGGCSFAHQLYLENEDPTQAINFDIAQYLCN